MIFVAVAGILYAIFAYPRGGAAGLFDDVGTGCFIGIVTLLGIGRMVGGVYLLVRVGGPTGAVGIGLIALGGLFVKIMWEETVKKRR